MFPHCVTALPHLIHGVKKFGDIERGLIMLKKNYSALYPPVRIAKRIGHDGTGLHCSQNKHLQMQSFSNEVFKKEYNLAACLNDKDNTLISNYGRIRYALFVNYFLFFIHKYIPRYYPVYEFMISFNKRNKFAYRN